MECDDSNIYFNFSLNYQIQVRSGTCSLEFKPDCLSLCYLLVRDVWGEAEWGWGWCHDQYKGQGERWG